MNVRRNIFSLLIVFSTSGIWAQDYNWWNELHNWDGVSPWRSYLTYTSKFMGPNALPVPSVTTGEFADVAKLEVGVRQHMSDGDLTHDFLTDILLPIVPGRAGLKLHYIPVEFYKVDTITRDLRVSRDYETSGYSFGDIYIATYIQVIKDHPKLPDLMLSVNLKTASGTNLGNARHTDASAYFFDASLGKTFETGHSFLTSWRPYFNGGFYSYQTNCSEYSQNDAFLFGLGIRVAVSILEVENQLAGYLGYFGNGDQPVVYRLSFLSRRESVINYKVGFQFGLHDVPYHSVSISGILKFENLKLFWGAE